MYKTINLNQGKQSIMILFVIENTKSMAYTLVYTAFYLLNDIYVCETILKANERELIASGLLKIENIFIQIT